MNFAWLQFLTTKIASCIICTDVGTGWMVNHGEDCPSSELIASKCNQNANWVQNKYCRQSCFNAGFGYPGDMCCQTASPSVVPSASPSATPSLTPSSLPSASPSTEPSQTPEGCVICDDVGTGWMVNHKEECPSSDLIENKCNKNANWVQNKYCRLTCYNSGYGYTGDECCNSNRVMHVSSPPSYSHSSSPSNSLAPFPSQPGPSIRPTLFPTESPRPTPIPSHSPTESPRPTPIPSFSPTVSSSPTQSFLPSLSLSPTNFPSSTPSISNMPTKSYFPSISKAPTDIPSITPTRSLSPSVEPTETSKPSPSPTVPPTKSVAPSLSPSIHPSAHPTPSYWSLEKIMPTPAPSSIPSNSPSKTDWDQSWNRVETFPSVAPMTNTPSDNPTHTHWYMDKLIIFGE